MSQVWNEFRANWEQMSLLSEAILQRLEARVARCVSTADLKDSVGDGQTESARLVKVRTMQAFFRKVVLAAYTSRCCITGNPVEELLVASHILPWVDFPHERLNPRNGLCLAAHFDRAFDRGLIGFDEHYRLVLSPALKLYIHSEAIALDFLRREGQPFLSPERFSPRLEFLAYHKNRIFRHG